MLALVHALAQVVQLQIHDLAHLVLGEALVVHDLVQTVQELGAELALQQQVDLLAGLVAQLIGALCAALLQIVQDDVTAQVGSQDDHRVLEVHGAALTVGDAAVVQHLQQDVEHVGVGLFHLIEQHHAVGLAAHSLGQLAALFITDISRRRTDQTADAELLHIFGHVDAHHVALIVKQSLCQRLGQFGLADTGGAQEQEAADGAVGVGNAGAAAQDGFADLGHGLVLADDSLVQHVIQMQQLLAFALHQLLHRDAGPAGHDAGNLLVGHAVTQQAVLFLGSGDLFFLFQLLLQLGQLAVLQLGGLVQVVLPLGLFDIGVGLLDLLPQGLHFADGVFLVFPLCLHAAELVLQFGQLFFQILQTALAQSIGLLFQADLLDLQLGDAVGQIIHLAGHAVHLGLDHGAGLIHQVDGLIRQETVGDVAVRQGGSGDQGAVVDLHAVEHLVPLLQAAQDGNSVLHGGLIHLHRLEPAFQSGVFLDILAVLVQGGGTDAVQLAAGQHGLEQVAGIHGTVGLAGTHDGVQLINEEDDLALALLDLVQHALQAFLELAAVLGTGHQSAHVQAEHDAVLQVFGHVTAHDPLGKALGDGSLADAGLTDQAGVVLGLTGQDADHVADLLITADDRVQLLLAGQIHQILTVFLQGVVGVLGVVRGHALVAAHGGKLLQKLVLGDAKGTEQFGGVLGRLIQQAEEHMLHADVLVLHGLGFTGGGAQDLVGGLRDIDLVRVAAGAGHPGQGRQLFGNGSGKAAGIHVQLLEQLRDQALLLRSKGVQQMFRLQSVVLVLHSQLLGCLQSFQSFLSILIGIHKVKPPFIPEGFDLADGQALC